MKVTDYKAPPVDFFGRDIVPGHKVVYPVASGSSSAQLVVALVHDVKVNPNGDYVLKVKRIREGHHKVGTYSYEDAERINTVHRWEKCVIVAPDAE